MESFTDVRILEVKSPSEFKARIVLPWEQAAHEKAWHQLQVEMEEIQRNTIINHDVHANELCALIDNRDDQWYRVRMEKVFHTSRGLQARCYFVDSGESHMFALNRVFKLPRDYHSDKLPFQVRTMKLWGLQPMTLTLELTDIGIEVPQRPSPKWDSSAHTFFTRLTEECDRAMVEVKGEDEKGRLLVVLYLQKNGYITNVNEVLIKEEYACALSSAGNNADRSGRRQFRDGASEKKTSPCHTNVSASSSGQRQQQRHHLQADSGTCGGGCAAQAVSDLDDDDDDMMIAANEQLTPAGLKEVLAKVRRNISEIRKCESDTEPLNSTRTRFRGKPILGCRIVPVSGNNDNAGVCEGSIQSVSGSKSSVCGELKAIQTVSNNNCSVCEGAIQTASNNNCGVCEGFKAIQAASPARGGVTPRRVPAKSARETWTQPDSECLCGIRRTTVGPHTMSKGSPPDSDSSARSEIQNILFSKRRSQGSHAKVKVCDASFAQTQHPQSSGAAPWTGVQVAHCETVGVSAARDGPLGPKKGTANLKAVLSSGDGVLNSKTGTAALNTATAAADRMLGPKPGAAPLKAVSSASYTALGPSQPSSANLTSGQITCVTYGRGRGLRKLLTEDIVRAVEAVGAAGVRASSGMPLSVAQKRDLKTETFNTTEKEMNNSKPSTCTNHGNSAFRTVNQQAGLNSASLLEKRLPAGWSEVQEEFYEKRKEAGPQTPDQTPQKQTGDCCAALHADSVAVSDNLLDLGRRLEKQLKQHVDGSQSGSKVGLEGSKSTSCTLYPINPHEIDLNNMPEDSPVKVSLSEMLEDSTSTSPTTCPISLHETDLNERSPSPSRLINPREIDLNMRTPSSPHPVNPREIDLNMRTPSSPRPVNPREIDLNMRTPSSPRPINPREIDVNDMENTNGNGSSSDDSREQPLLNRLFTSKNHDAEEAKLKVPLVWRPDRSMPNPFLGTITWGIHLPNPVFDVDDIVFNSVVKSYLEKECFQVPRAIQAYTWPALMRGRNVIGITPRHSGKTTAYLPPLVSELLNFPKYQKLPKGMGPKAIILVSSCKKADSVFHYAQCMIQQRSTLLRVLCIYGSENHLVMPLLRGCDLLIATPHCLLRMLHSRYTQLDRLCHLVLDGAEVMVEEFTDEVREVMTLYAEKLRRYQGLPVPRQVMMFGYQWTPGMVAFQKAYQPDPVLVFASRLEASVYGKVEQVVHMCFEKMHMNTLKGLVEQLTTGSEEHRIVIATTNTPSVAMIDQLLRSLSVYAQVIDCDAEITVIEESVGRWLDQNGPSVLVVTDNNVTELRVTSAHTVIHFDLPNSQTKFGNRLALMLDFFQDSCSKQGTQDKRRGQSHLLVTNTMLDYVQSLHSFLLRSSATIPTTMERLLDGMHEGKNEDESKALCPKLKQFGQCRYEVKCEHRHLVLPCDVIHDDSPEAWLPASGMIKIRVLKVLDTSHYYALLLEHQAPGQPRKNFQSVHTSLTMDLAMYLANEKNQVPFVLEEGKKVLAAVKDSEGTFHRARVLSVRHATLQTGSTQVEVLYVDEGNQATVRPDQLLKLPPKLQEVPPLAVEVYICRVKPVDGDTEWTRSSTTHIKSQLKDKDLLGNIVLRMKNTLWLDPLAHQTKLKNIKTNIISLVVRPDLLKRGFAHDNPDHVKNLYKVCEGKIPIDKKLWHKYLNIKPRQELEMETLKGDEEYHGVCVTVVDDPQHFFVQKLCNRKTLEHMQQELKKGMERMLADGTILPPPTPESKTLTLPTSQAKSTPPTKGALPQDDSKTAAGEERSTAPSSRRSSTASSATREAETSCVELSRFEQGCLCAAKFEEDGSWNRAQVLEKAEDGWKVFFVDYGERLVIPDSDVHPLPDQFCKLPAQAIECGLGHVSPTGEEWSEVSSDLVWNLSHTVDRDLKQLSAKVYETQSAEVAGTTKYIVELYDMHTLNRELRFSQELVWAHEAITDDENFENLFPKVFFSPRRVYPDLDAKLENSCAALYWIEEDNKTKYVTKLITDVVGNLNAQICLAKGKNGLQQVVQLIGYLRSCDAHSAILSALIKCVESNPRECAGMFGKKLVLQLVFCMEQAHRPAVQLQAASAALQLAKMEGFTPCMDQMQIISVMIEMLKSEDPSTEMLNNVCTFLAYMLTHGTLCADEFDSQKMGPVVFGIMAEINEPDTLETLLSLVAAMAPFKQLQTFIMREKPIQQILSIMREQPSLKCVCYCAHICQLLCQTSRRNKRILLEAQLVLVVKELLDSGVGSPLRELCEELNRSLAVTVPQQQVLAGVQISSHAAGAAGGDKSVQMPLMKWSQNSFRVLVTVKVEGAKESDFTITPHEIRLRCESGGQVYGFDHTLFGQVVPDKCRISVQHMEVILSLSKYNKGMWSRLLHKKQKCAHLVTDFDKLVDSSESEVEDCENVATLSRKRDIFAKMGKPEPLEYHFSYEEGSSTESSDQLGSFSEDERFEDPSEMVDPLSVMDELIYMNAHPK